MIRHIALIVCLTIAALVAGWAMVPGEHEQWTMLVRDGHNQEALKVLETRYRQGRRDTDAVVHLYRLYMSFAEIERATQVMQNFAAAHPDDPEIIAMLARHYDDIQDKSAAIRTLEQLYALAPSLQTARTLLAQYRLEGAFDREEGLLRSLLANDLITANDAERLGLMLAARGDFYGAREALTRFDEIANPERSIGRFVLFDVLIKTGDSAAALTKAASWIGYFRKASPHRAAEGDTPSARLTRMMMAVDEAATRALICDTGRGELAERPRDEVASQEACTAKAPVSDNEAQPPANAVSRIEWHEEPPRRRRR
jgi:tetratricopeptide (TPR) repeat protein